MFLYTQGKINQTGFGLLILRMLLNEHSYKFTETHTVYIHSHYN